MNRIFVFQYISANKLINELEIELNRKGLKWCNDRMLSCDNVEFKDTPKNWFIAMFYDEDFKTFTYSRAETLEKMERKLEDYKEECDKIKYMKFHNALMLFM